MATQEKPPVEVYQQQIKQMLDVFELDCYITRKELTHPNPEEVWYISRPGWWSMANNGINVFWCYSYTYIGWKINFNLNAELEDFNAEFEYLTEALEKLKALNFPIKHDYRLYNRKPIL